MKRKGPRRESTGTVTFYGLGREGIWWVTRIRWRGSASSRQPLPKWRFLMQYCLSSSSIPFCQGFIQCRLGLDTTLEVQWWARYDFSPSVLYIRVLQRGHYCHFDSLRSSIVVGSCPLNCRMFSSSPSTPIVTTQSVCRHCHTSPGMEWNHSQLRTTQLGQV